MSSRTQHDSVIDDDEELCPLCIEEFDLSDKNFKPCPCGYQICQFCYNNIKTHSEEGRCPNCRRVYDESTIQYRVPDADEFKADLALKHRKAAAAKKKETEKREIEASSRKNLAGVRVVQKNLVYVIGLNPSIRDESQLLQTLRGDQYFGQYGDIEKIVVSKAKPGGNANQGIGVYVTFARKADAATCITAVDGSPNGDRVLRAQYGTTKYCSSFLRNEQCNNRNCTFLHETGDDSDSFTRQDLSSINTLSSQRFHPGVQSGANQPPHPQSRQSHPHAQAGPSGSAARQANTKDEAANRTNADGSALPSSASWANKDSHVQRARRASMTASRSTPSPKSASASVVSKNEDSKPDKRPQPNQTSAPQDSQAAHTPGASQSPSTQTSPNSDLATQSTGDVVLDNLVKAITSPDFRFVFSASGLAADEVAPSDNYPSMIDPYGGVKRRAMREKAEQERAKQEADSRALLQPNQLEDENPESGSSQLGGEPDETNAAPTSVQTTNQPSQNTIQPPQQGSVATSGVGSPLSTVQQFQNLSLNGRTLTPQQQQQLMLKGAGGQQVSLADQLPTNTTVGGFDQNPLARAGSLPNQAAAMGGMHGHARQSSRFSFANDSGSKNVNSQRMAGQQSSMMQALTPNPLATPSAQPGLGSQYFVSGVQGPPPGLKTAGTPPVSGGGMFAKGHGFTSQMNNNLGLNPEGNADLMRELMRGRGGNSGAGGVQAPEAPKREFMSPFLQQHNTPPPVAPVSGLLNGSVYGYPPGTQHEQGRQKQKKRGKKHRHANTSSGGGGVVDLADPSILQARMHQGGANAAAAATAAGQGLYGSQGQAAGDDFPPLGLPVKQNEQSHRFPSPLKTLSESPIGRQAGTPSVPPGFSLPHAHPSAGQSTGSSTASPVAQSDDQSAKIQPPPGLTKTGNMEEGKPQKLSTPEEVPVAAASATDDNNTTDLPSRSRAEKSKMSEQTPGKPVTMNAEQAEQRKDETPATPVKHEAKASKDTPVKKPIKLDTSVPAKSRDSSPSKPPAPGQSETHATSSAATGSRPDTPASATSRTPEPSHARQARVLRVVDTSKSEFPSLPPASASSETAVPVAKQRSRRASQSQSSFSRPTTPPEVGSEYTSASASRTNSPAPNRVGSAPVRTASKNQVKKDRKQKAKQAEAMKEDIASAAAAEEPVQAPIIGRKRKNKKPSAKPPAEQPSAGAAAAEVDDEKASKRQQAPATKDNEKKDAGPQKEKKTEQPVEAWRSNNTVEQLLADAEATGASIKDLFLERTSSLPTILAQLHQSGDIDLNTHPLFNSPPPSNLRVDMKCTADDYEKLKRPIELTSEHRKQLLRGEPVRINAHSDLLKERCLITPGGCVLRHLSVEEEDRYLEVEKSLASKPETRLEWPPFVMDEPDPTNCNGGLDALFATPEKFNIRWVDDAPQSSLITGASDPGRPTSSSQAETDNASRTAVSGATASSQAMPAGPGYGTVLDELSTMRDEELRVMIDMAQKDLETTRKEADAMDKKMTALVKRNKKLVQQALSLAKDPSHTEGQTSA